MSSTCDTMQASWATTSCVMVHGLLAAHADAISQWANELVFIPNVELTWEKGAITRAENFQHLHEGFRKLTDGESAMASVCSSLFGEPAVLFKEKLNYKPAGGAGFMPHLDHPSLMYYALPHFDSFITVMLAIDDMTEENGCLRVCKGAWSAANAVACMAPEGDPEVGGRAGAIATEVVSQLSWESVPCRAGDCFFFNGYIPHRSAANATAQPRRAVFFTFNPLRHGDFRTQYYANLAAVRQKWKAKLVAEMEHDYSSDLAAMASIPAGGFNRGRYAAAAALAQRRVDESEESSASEHETTVGALF